MPDKHLTHLDVSNDEPLLTLKEVTRLPWMRRSASGKPLALSVVYRWVHNGIAGHKLAALNAGGCICTTEAAVKEFFRKLTEERVGELSHADRSGTRRDRRGDHVSAVNELMAAGIA